MNEIELGSSGLRTPQIGFGCSALLGRSGRSDSLKALGAAWDQGIRFFDTARAYGYGESEGLLGEFLRGRRDQAVIATKFGILPSPQALWKKAARAVARQVLAVAPSARKILQKGAATQFHSNQFTVAVLKQSIDESLQKLATDRVEFLFMHAAPASVLEQEDLLDAMGRLVEAGKVRVAGISAEPDVIALALERRIAPLNALQFPCNVFELSAAIRFSKIGSSGHVLVANHPFGGVARVQSCRALLREFADKPGFDAVLREKIGGLEDGIFADLVLNTILRDTGIHVVIPAMMRVEHVRANVRAVAQSRFTSAEIAQIRKAFASAPSPVVT
jgi:aryl-alcohol dehydrogenase-like predicted oxidoreductase